MLEKMKGGEVVIKGDDGDEAVLCTSDATYAIKKVDSTNTMWVLRPGERETLFHGSKVRGRGGSSPRPARARASGGGRARARSGAWVRGADSTHRAPVCDAAQGEVARVAAHAKSHLELVETEPRLERLRELLLEHLYTGPDEEPAAGGLIGRAALAQRVQASDSQLARALVRMGAFELDGAMRVAAPEYTRYILLMLLTTVAENDGWELSKVPEREACEQVAEAGGHRVEFVRHVLREYSEADSMDVDASEDARTWALDLPRVSREFASELLLEVMGIGTKEDDPVPKDCMELQSMLSKWKERVFNMDELPVEASQLRGLALVEPCKVNPSEMKVWPFIEDMLPRAHSERFRVLFERREQWLWKDLEPYVAPLDTGAPTTKVDVLLMKYCRTIQPSADAPKLYSKR